MQVSVEKTSELSRKMTVHVPEELIQEKMEARLKTAARQVKLKGFRPGKVPQHVVKKMYGPQIRNEVTGELIQSSYVEALQEQQQKPAGPPSIVPSEETGEGKGFEYIAEFEVFPEVSLEGIENLEVTRQIAEVEDADLEAMIEKLRVQKKDWKVAEQPSRQSDRVTVSFSGTKDGENFTDGTIDDYKIIIGEQQMIPGFEDNLVGLNAGDNKTFELTFPNDYGNEDLAGKTAQFDVTVSKVEEPFLPEVDVDFIKDYGIEGGDMERFRNDIKENMQRELTQAVRAKTKKALMDQLFDRFKITLPNTMVDREIDAMMQPYIENAKKRNENIEDMNLPREGFEKEARRRVALSLILGEVVVANEIKLDNARVRSTVEDLAQSYEHPEEVVNYYFGDKNLLAEVERMVLEDQAVDWILDRVKVNEESTTFEALMNQQGQ